MAKRKWRDNEAQLDELGSDPGQVGSDSAGQSGMLRGSRKSLPLPPKASKNSPTLSKRMRRRQSAVSRMLLTTPRGLCTPRRAQNGAMAI